MLSVVRPKASQSPDGVGAPEAPTARSATATATTAIVKRFLMSSLLGWLGPVQRMLRDVTSFAVARLGTGARAAPAPAPRAPARARGLAARRRRRRSGRCRQPVGRTQPG